MGEFVIGVAVIIAGVYAIRYPETFYEFREGWKSNYVGEPSEWYIRSVKIGGVIAIVLGIFLILSPFFMG